MSNYYQITLICFFLFETFKKQVKYWSNLSLILIILLLEQSNSDEFKAPEGTYDQLICCTIVSYIILNKIIKTEKQFRAKLNRKLYYLYKLSFLENLKFYDTLLVQFSSLKRKQLLNNKEQILVTSLDLISKA